MLTSRGLGRVLGDLATMGFDAKWGVLGAADVGANHQRDRIWIVAKWRGQLSHAQHDRIGRWEQQQASIKETTSNVANTREVRPCGKKTKQGMARELRFAECGVDRNWWQREPEFVPRTTQLNMGRVANGVASRVDRLKSIGNGQVPLCAATAWKLLSERI
jgi:DNA (cytosine-5)-methyltransferase 1